MTASRARGTNTRATMVAACLGPVTRLAGAGRWRGRGAGGGDVPARPQSHLSCGPKHGSRGCVAVPAYRVPTCRAGLCSGAEPPSVVRAPQHIAGMPPSVPRCAVPRTRPPCPAIPPVRLRVPLWVPPLRIRFRVPFRMPLRVPAPSGASSGAPSGAAPPRAPAQPPDLAGRPARHHHDHHPARVALRRFALAAWRWPLPGTRWLDGGAHPVPRCEAALSRPLH